MSEIELYRKEETNFDDDVAVKYFDGKVRVFENGDYEIRLGDALITDGNIFNDGTFSIPMERELKKIWNRKFSDK